MTTQEITFERETRDCPANDRLGNGAGGGRFIYDYRVMIGGEHRATFKKMNMNKNSFGAYQLFDCEGRPIRDSLAGDYWPRHFGVPVESQAQFESTVRGLLRAGRIPTRADALAETERLAAVDSALKAECESECFDMGLAAHAREMWDALAALAIAHSEGRPLDSAIASCRAAHATAHLTANKSRAAETEFRQRYLSAKRY